MPPTRRADEGIDHRPDGTPPAGAGAARGIRRITHSRGGLRALGLVGGGGGPYCPAGCGRSGVTMRKFLGEILVEMESCTEADVQGALDKQMNANDRRPIGEILVEMEKCQPEDVARALAEQYDMRFYDLDTID